MVMTAVFKHLVVTSWLLNGQSRPLLELELDMARLTPFQRRAYAVARAIPFSLPALWVQLHLGAPGSAGTANPAANTTRVQLPAGRKTSKRDLLKTAAPAATTESAEPTTPEG